MSTSKFFATLASIAIFSACGCTSSDENEPQDTPVYPEAPAEEEVQGVGLSRKNAYIGARTPYDNDTIEIATDDWVIRSVSFCDERYLEYPYHFPKTTYMTDISGAAPFDETVAWLRMDYAEGQLVLSDIDPYIGEVREWPKYRYAFVEFERNGEVVDTLICKDESEMPAGFSGIGPNPENVFFTKAGGSVNMKTKSEYWAFHWLKVDGVKHDFGNGDPSYFEDESTWTEFDFAFTLDWVTIERNKYGDPTEITVTVAPNDTGVEREFTCGIGPWAVWGVFSCHQAAD